ncbi:MAG TPA: HEAT repeat domain-containing protein, partial [Pirellulaceae bacterium]|nr:HEAT repeat domain-containing protein [Pirellulaceae bacterium]
MATKQQSRFQRSGAADSTVEEFPYAWHGLSRVASFALSFLFSSALLFAQPVVEEVEVVADSAKVKVGDEVIASVEKGAKFTVLRREGQWVAIEVEIEQAKREGWIFAARLRTVIEPGATEDLTAPGTPDTIQFGIDMTQVALLSSNDRAIYFQLSIKNRGLKPVHYDASDVVLELDGNSVKHSEAPQNAYATLYVNNPATPQRMTMLQPAQLMYLATGELLPGDEAVGWLRFELANVRRASELADKKWLLAAKIGDKTVKFDLKKAELDALGAKVRPSTIDESVQIIEVDSRINGVNAGELVKLLKPIVEKREGCALVVTDDKCLVDYSAYSEIRLLTSRPGNLTVFVAPRGQGALGSMVRSGAHAATEAAAVMRILGDREGTGPKLAIHLSDPKSETRAAAATALAKHTSEPGVFTALIKAATDENASVRSAVTTALVASTEPKATEAIIVAMTDSEASVRRSAALAAGGRESVSVAEPLIKLLDDEDANVVIASCSSLGTLKLEEAVLRLQNLQTGDRLPVATAAIDALRAIGNLTAVEAARTKLSMGNISAAELNVLSQAKDKEAVPLLLLAMKSATDANYVRQVATVLGNIGDAAAVEPLLNMLNNSPEPAAEVTIAVGKLGDKRAIEPLQQALLRATGAQRAPLQEALLTLDAPGVFEQLCADLKNTEDSKQKAVLMRLLGRAGGGRAIAVIEPFLDDQRFCQQAAAALLGIASGDALAPLEQRLLSEGYQHTRTVLPQLISVASSMANTSVASSQVRSGVSVSTPPPKLAQERLRQINGLLRKLTKSSDSSLRGTATRYFESIDRRVVQEELSEFLTHVTAKRFDAADKEAQASIQHLLDTIDNKPDEASRLTYYLDAMRAAYIGIGESHRAVHQTTQIMAMLDASFKEKPNADLAEILMRHRASNIVIAMQANKSIEPKEVQKVLTYLLADLASKIEEGVTSKSLSTLLSLAKALEAKDQLALAAEAYTGVAKVIAKSEDENLANAAVKLEGAARRLTLPGKHMELTGTLMDGNAFDWDQYRGKVVLVDFWATWCPPCLVEMPNIKKNYDLYHNRGFDVVGISLDRDRTALERYIEKQQLPWSMLYQQDAVWNHPMASHYGVTAIPSSILVDREGKVVSLRARGKQLDELLLDLIGPRYTPDGNSSSTDAQPKGGDVKTYRL